MDTSSRIPPLPALRAFSTVAKVGSFTRAASALNVTTSAISHQIRNLEDALGIKLLVRPLSGGAALIPTEAGLEFLSSLDDGLMRLEDACRRARAAASGGTQPLEISANSSVAALWLAPRLARFSEKLAPVSFKMRAIEHNPDLEREDLDLAIIRQKSSSLIGSDERMLFAESVFPVHSPNLDLRNGFPNDQSIPLLEEDPGTSDELSWETWTGEIGVTSTPRIVRFSTFASAISAAVAGTGVAIGRSPLIDEELRSGRLVRLNNALIRQGQSQFALRRRSRPRHPHVDEVSAYLVAS